MINTFDLFTLTFSGVALASDRCSVVSVCLSRAERASERTVAVMETNKLHGGLPER